MTFDELRTIVRPMPIEDLTLLNEEVEYARKDVRRDADARVAHGQHDLAVERDGTDGNLAIGRCVVDDAIPDDSGTRNWAAARCRPAPSVAPPTLLPRIRPRSPLR
jgi:hypothetical protein